MNKKNNQKSLIIIVVVIILALLFCFGYTRYCTKLQLQDNLPQIKVADVSDISTSGQSVTPADTYDCPGFAPDITIAKGQSMALTNPNKDTYYLRYTFADANGKTLYQSDLIAPGVDGKKAVLCTPSDFISNSGDITITVQGYSNGSPCQSCFRQVVAFTIVK